MIPNPCIEFHTSPLDRPSVPAWFAEVVTIARHLATNGLLDVFAHRVRLVRGRFGSYEPIDFLVLLLGRLSSSQIDEHMRVKPNQGMQHSERNALLITLIPILPFGLVGVLLSALFSALSKGSHNTLGFGLLLGLIAAVEFGGMDYIRHFVLRFVLWWNKCMPRPWQYIRFLDDVTRCILLYRVGGGFRFAHKFLLDYFASLAAPRSATEEGAQLSKASSLKGV